MDKIDFSAPKHLAAIAKLRDLARWPHHCVVTKRATEDIVKLRLTKAAVLEALSAHLAAKKPTYVLMQESEIEAYVLLPCAVDVHHLYVKVQVPPCDREKDEVLVIISAHIPEYGPPKEKVNVKRKK
jgi:hypothetical protein